MSHAVPIICAGGGNIECCKLYSCSYNVGGEVKGWEEGFNVVRVMTCNMWLMFVQQPVGSYYSVVFRTGGVLFIRQSNRELIHQRRYNPFRGEYEQLLNMNNVYARWCLLQTKILDP